MTTPAATGLVGFLPSPSRGTIDLGPLALNAYGMCIAVGAVAAVWLTSKRWVAKGGHPQFMERLAITAIPAGIIGARIYHVATDWRSFQGRWGDVFRIWEGGLGIWGGIALGVTVGLVGVRRQGGSVALALHCVAPALPLAQAIGRWGNWFNIELFGRPSTVPWALEVPARKRPASFKAFETFHPTFLYESLWNLAVCVLLIVLSGWFLRRFRLGAAFAGYVALYTLGRYFIERIRIDNATKVGGLRVNEIVSVVCFAVAAGVLVALRKKKKQPPEPLPTLDSPATEATEATDAPGGDSAIAV